MRVLLLHTAPPADCSSGRLSDEFDLTEVAANVANALQDPIVARVSGEPSEILKLLASHQPDVVFNLCEAPLGQPRLEHHIAALFEWMGVRFTGSRSETLALCRRKDRINGVLAAHGVRVPGSTVFPLIVKPADEDGSAGLTAESICEDAQAVARACERLGGPVVIQEFLPGREFVVSLWGPGEPLHVSIGEMLYKNGLRLVTYAAKWDVKSPDFANTDLDYRSELTAGLRDEIIAAARGAWRAAGVRGYLRVDIRCDTQGTPFVLDVNPNPELGPGVGICRAVQEAGWSWEAFVRSQLEWA